MGQRLEVRTEVEIGRPADEVWSFVVEGYFAHHAQWDPAVVDMVRDDSGPLRAGSTGVEVRRFGGNQSAAFEVIDAERCHRFALRNTSGPFELDRAYELEQRADVTRLAFTFVMAPKGPMRLLFPFVRGVIRRQVVDNIARIPGLVASAATDGDGPRAEVVGRHDVG
jgi:hypothetical protein